MARRPGIALLNALLFTFITSVFLIVGIQFSQNAMKQGRKSIVETQAYNVALAGINHAVQWLQKQSTQPVLSFDPRGTVAPDEESEVASGEEQLGLVNEFTVDPSANLWGRYEVGRSSNAPPRDGLATGAMSPLYGVPSWTAEDVSRQRGLDQAGMVWRIRSRGYVFKRQSNTAPFSLTSPAPMKTVTLEGEIRRAVFKFRETAIYSFMDGGNAANPHVDIDDSNGGGTIIEVPSGAKHYWSNSPSGKYRFDGSEIYVPSPKVGIQGANVPTNVADYVSPQLNDQLQYVFGTTDLNAIRALADAYYTANSQIPDTQPAMGFIYIKPTSGLVEFKEGGSNPTLNGGGILFVDGDLKIDGNSGPQEWTGLIFVTGKYTQLKNSSVTGGVMCGNVFLIHGDSNNDKIARLTYSPSDLSRINAQLGNYRLDRATLRLVDSVSGAPTF